MKRFCAILVVLLFAGLYLMPSAAAKSRMGVVKMKNGSRIYGEILKDNAEEVVLRFTFGTTGFGEITIDKVFVALENGVTYKGSVKDDIVEETEYPGDKPGNDKPTPPEPVHIFCFECRVRVSEADLRTGKAKKIDGKDYCLPCAEKLDKPPEPPIPEPLGPVVTIPGMNCSLRPPVGWNKAEYPAGKSVSGKERTMLVFTGATRGNVNPRILVGRMPAVPLASSEREKFIVNLMKDDARQKFTKQRDGKINAPNFGGETYFVKGKIGQTVFRHNFYFSHEHTYVLAFYAFQGDFKSLQKVFDAVTDSFKIQE